jgi:hypothetical protein
MVVTQQPHRGISTWHFSKLEFIRCNNRTKREAAYCEHSVYYTIAPSMIFLFPIQGFYRILKQNNDNQNVPASLGAFLSVLDTTLPSSRTSKSCALFTSAANNNKK